MFLSADIVVKAVMIGLAFASVLTWTIWFAKSIELMVARRRCGAIAALGQARNVRTRPASRACAAGGPAALVRAAAERDCGFRPAR